MASNYTRSQPPQQQSSNVIKSDQGDVTITIRSNGQANNNGMNWGDIETRDTDSIRSYTPSSYKKSPRVFNFYDYLDYVNKSKPKPPPPQSQPIVYRAVQRPSAVPQIMPYPVPQPIPMPMPTPYAMPPPPPQMLPPPQIYALPPPPPPPQQQQQQQQQEQMSNDRKFYKSKNKDMKPIVVDSDSEVLVLPKQNNNKSPRRRAEPQQAYYVTEVDDEYNEYENMGRGGEPSRVVYAPRRSPRREIVYANASSPLSNKPLKPAKSQVIYLEDKPTRQIQLQQRRSSPVKYVYPVEDEFY